MSKTCQEEQQEIEIGFEQNKPDRETFDDIIKLSEEGCWGRWDNLIYFSRLQEDWLREGKDYMGKKAWAYIVKYQEATKDFIREFKDKILPLSVVSVSIIEARYGKKFLEEIVGKDFDQ